MAWPSKGAQVFPVVFGGIFMAFGLFFATAMLSAAPGHVQGNRWAGVLFSAIFVAIGGGVIYAGIYGNRKLKEQAAAPGKQSAIPMALAEGLGSEPSRKQQPQQRHRTLAGGDFLECDYVPNRILGHTSTLADLCP